MPDNNFYTGILIFVLITLAVSCKKTEGEGGGASIQGKVYHNLYYKDNFVDTQEARDEDVFIIYGNNERYDDDYDTHWDGTYRFNYLRKGSYRIFAYQECDSCDSEVAPVEVSVKITKKKDMITAPDIILRQNVDPDDGTATIKGKIFVIDSTQFPVNTYPAQDERVYIRYGEDVIHFEDVRSDNGWYEFKKLIKGEYTVFAYSECLNCSPVNLEVKSTTVVIADNGETVQANDITIVWRGF